MNTICLDIFQAIHEGKWLSIEYKNGQGEITRYWIGIKSLHPDRRTLCVEGLHLSRYTVMELTVYIDSIQSSAVIDGSYFPVNEELIRDIEEHPKRYRNLFGHAANLKILNYLEDCSRLDTVPYKTEYALIDHLDGDWQEEYCLSEKQFQEIVANFQYGAKNKKNSAMNRKIRQIAMNVLSINTPKGLYVLAYHKMRLNVKEHTLRQDEEIVICTEFTVNGNKYSIRNFLDAEDYELLEDFEENAELIKDRIQQSNPQIHGVDDMPYLIAIGRDVVLDLHGEYEAIHRMYEEDRVTIPIRAFFGELLRQTGRRKDYPIALLDRRINLDQLLAIHNAMKYPLAYIQGPPGTGKTNTIVNTIVTAFFNEKTVLFASYNNHPIDGVCEKLQQIPYLEKGYIPFPIIRLGNDEKVAEALDYISRLYERTMNISVFDGTLERNKGNKVARTQQLTELLRRHEEKLDLQERRDAIQKLMDTNHHLTFQTSLQGVQLEQVERQLAQIGDITDEEALGLVIEDEEEFKKYLYYTSAKYIKRLHEPKNEDLREILDCEDRDERVRAFNAYLKNEENLKKFQRIFPIIATTSISAHKIGEPGTYFDMVIMDEASQGNIATSLVPVIRGRNLMLVGDPQQLSPVILLNPVDNAKLRKTYSVPDEYDYIKNSIYKTYLAADAVSGEILLSHHYRCNKKIIDFNNRKYYNDKLVINSRNAEANPLIFQDIRGNTTEYKNTAPREVQQIIRYAQENPDKSIGVITPFANQKNLINDQIQKNGLSNVACGTVHAFQGDEKDTVLFSLALTDKTGYATYEWLKNNKELINVATSRAKNQLIILSSKKELDRLHTDEPDDLYELVRYVQTNGTSQITPRVTSSRALGIKPYSSETEMAFLATLNHALDNVLNTDRRCIVRKEVSISHVFQDNVTDNDLFYTGRFDFVVYERDYYKKELPILAIELDGREHAENAVVMERDRKKNEICRAHGFELIRVENTYARRYNYIKDILIRYFKGVQGY
jgi:DNA-directed RNA polymerase subunit L